MEVKKEEEKVQASNKVSHDNIIAFIDLGVYHFSQANTRIHFQIQDRGKF